MTVRNQMLAGLMSATDVVLQDRIGGQPSGFSIDEHQRCALLPWLQVRHIAADRTDDHARDLALQYRFDRLPFVRRLPSDGGHDHRDTPPACLALDCADDAGEERVGHAGHRNADRGVASATEGDGEHVRHVLEVFDRPLDPFADVGGDIAVVVDDARDRLGAHPRPVGNVAHGRHRAPFLGRSAVSMSPMSDRTVEFL
jgi:hypothetical protein